MGSKWFTGGVSAAPRGRIRFDFKFEGSRYRPTIRRPPSEANLRRARERLTIIKQQIEVGTFDFAEEFPDYRFLRRINGAARVRSCNDVFNDFLAHCEARFAKEDMAAATLMSYRRVLNGVWQPNLGKQLFHQVRYSTLVKIADERRWGKKTYNNVISIVRRAFEFGYRDHPEQHNPAKALRGARLRWRDRPRIDPFSIQDAETLIAAIHRDWGEAQGNYDEFRLFTGLRPSEEIALMVGDLDLAHGIINIHRARVAGVERNCTKTARDRRVALCPRAVQVLEHQLRLRERLQAAGKIVQSDGKPLRNLQYAQARWRRTFRALPLRYRRPYVARHSSVSWNLMIGKNPLWVAKQHGHSIETMLRVYAAWAEGAVEADVAAIQRAMESRPATLSVEDSGCSSACRERTRRASCGTRRQLTGGREGFEYGLLIRQKALRNQYVADFLKSHGPLASLVIPSGGSRADSRHRIRSGGLAPGSSSVSAIFGQDTVVAPVPGPGGTRRD